MDHRQQQLRQDLAAAYRLMALDGMDDGISTHISVRVDANRFLLNPFGLRFEEVTADSLISVDEQGNVLDDPTGLGINPAGFTIHSAIHGARQRRIVRAACSYRRGRGRLLPRRGSAAA